MLKKLFRLLTAGYRPSWALKDNFVLLSPKNTSRYVKITPTVIVYLPKNYNMCQRRYPVLYALDGQNLFDEKTSFVGEWYLDDCMENLVDDDLMDNIIVVGIYNNGVQRVHDYTPTVFATEEETAGGQLRQHGDFVIKELRPYINKKFRTLPDRLNTGIMGSSLGGLAAFYLLGMYPQIFGKSAAISPSFWWNNCGVLQDIDRLTFPRDCKLYIDGGWLESGDEYQMITFMRQVYRKLRQQGLKDFDNLFYYEDPDGEHNESVWARRVRMPLIYLYGKFKPVVEAIDFKLESRHYSQKNIFSIVPWLQLVDDIRCTPLNAKFTVSDSAIASIDPEGKTLVHKPGTVTLGVTVNGQSKNRELHL